MQPISNDVDLVGRQKAEALFHDRKYATRDAFPRHYQAGPTEPVLRRMLAMLGDDLSGVRVLEYGCGDGWITGQLAARGATVSAFDISGEAVAQARRVVQAAGFSEQCDIQVMGGEQLGYADSSFDVAIGFAILHHLQMDQALSELHRVLKPGGEALFAEPLASNPLIRLYRRLTPQYRTPDETPIDLKSFGRRVSAFRDYTHGEQLLLASGALALCYVPGLVRAARPVQRWLMKVDDVILRAVPGAGRWAWYSILRFKK